MDSSDPAQGAEQAERHRQFAVELFNFVWTQLNNPERTPADDDTMLHAAHASRFHWGKVGAPMNLARGEWQVSRVYATLNRPEPALFHARRCLEICQAHDIGDFDLAFAYEALARASALAGRRGDRERYLQLAREAARAIAEDDDRALLLGDLDTLPPA